MMDSNALPDAVTLVARAKGLFTPAAMGYYQCALQARQQLASASAILEKASAIARDACLLAQPSFERSGLMRRADALASAQRDLEMFAQVTARALLAAEHSHEDGYLRQVAMASNLDLDFADSSPLMLGFAWSVASQHLQGHALWRFRAACERAQSALRNAASGAALSGAASEIANTAYPMLATAHPELDQIYGAATANKCLRDLSMMLGTASHEWLLDGRQAPISQWLNWLLKAIGPHVTRYSGDIWGGVFASLCAATLGRVTPQHVIGCAAPLLEISLHGHALRRAVHGMLRAQDAGELSARRHSASLAAAARHQQRVAQFFTETACASVLSDHAYAERALMALLNDSQVTQASEACLLGLGSVGAEAMGVAYTVFVAQALDNGVEATRTFSALQREWQHLPEIAATAAETVSPAHALAPWLTSVLARVFELAVSHAPAHAERALARSLFTDFAGLSGCSPAEEAGALHALVLSARRHAGCASVERLVQLLDALDSMAKRWIDVLAMRASADLSEPSTNGTWISALSAQLALVLLSGASRLVTDDVAHWLATAWVVQLRFAAPEQSPETLAAAKLAELQGKLPEELRAGVARLSASINDATTAVLLLAHAEQWCTQAVAELSTRAIWAGMSGMEPRCVRDLTLLLKTAGCVLGSGYGEVEMRVRAFAAAHLLPYLRNETRVLGPELVSVLSAQMQQLNTTARARVGALLASVYLPDGTP
jgi:hypothetical protein